MSTGLSLPHPLEKLNVPNYLDGRDGANRAHPGNPCQIQANDDLQAINVWLAEFRDSPRTQRHYRKEAERLLLWALMERGKPLSSLSREDCISYEEFLSDPQPRHRWCGPRVPRFSPQWRPFLGPLCSNSRRTAMLVINALFSYLVQAGYLAGNPLALARRRGPQHYESEQTVERYLEHDQWCILLDTIDDLPQETERQRQHYERTRFLLALLYLLSPRVHEVASHTMGSFRNVRGRWWWEVTGKGNRKGRVPVNTDMIKALKRYRLFLGLTVLPMPDETTPLIMRLKSKARISENMIYRIIKDLVNRAAVKLEATDPHRAAILKRASTHWFRHTSISHQADAGIELQFLRRNARHVKLETTGLYMHAEEEAWHNAMERHRLRE